MEAVLESQQNIKKARKEVENLIYKIMDILDPSNANSSWYKKKFASMSDNQFYEYFKQDFPLKFQMKLFDIEPKMYQIEKAAKTLNVPLMEKVYLPFIYTSNDGKPVKTNYEASPYNLWHVRRRHRRVCTDHAVEDRHRQPQVLPHSRHRGV